MAVEALPPPCQPEECATLDGPCRKGECDEAKRACVVRTADEGAPCAEDSICGSARCQGGECVFEDPPDCSDLDGDCRAGMCVPGEGCVSVDFAGPGTSCATALTFPLSGTLQASAVEPGCGAPDQTLRDATGAQGAAVYYELDLSELPEPREVLIRVEADRDISGLLTRGDCGDLAASAQVESNDWSLQPAGVRYQQVLEPARYHLVVAGTEAGVLSTVLAYAEFTDVFIPPTYDEHPCEDPATVDLSTGLAQLWVNVRDPDEYRVECRGTGDRVARCFFLDARERDEPLWLQLDTYYATVGLYREGELACPSMLHFGYDESVMLDPGAYWLTMEHYGEGMIEARLETPPLSECSSNISCESATPLDVSGSSYTFSGDTVCGVDLIEIEFEEPPRHQLFYSLDLSQEPAPVQIDLEGSSFNVSVASIIELDADGQCTGVAHDCWPPCTVEPGVHYLVISTDYPSKFETTLTIER